MLRGHFAVTSLSVPVGFMIAAIKDNKVIIDLKQIHIDIMIVHPGRSKSQHVQPRYCSRLVHSPFLSMHDEELSMLCQASPHQQNDEQVSQFWGQLRQLALESLLVVRPKFSSWPALDCLGCQRIPAWTHSCSFV